MNIALLEPIGISKEEVLKLSKPLRDAGHNFTYYENKTTDIEELIKRSIDQDVVMIANNPYPKAVIEKANRLKMIAVAFTGIDHVDEAYCKERGIEILNCAGYSDVAVSELVIGLTIELFRKVKQGDIATRNEGTSLGLIGNEIAGKTVGIIGLGHIGTKTAKLFKAFDARVIAYNRSDKAEFNELGIERVDLDTLLKESDIISLHLPNNSETKGFISKEKIELMKKSAIFINCARGPIVDNVALAEALNNERIAGAAIDVFDYEPPLAKDYPLVNAKNIILTPHVAFLTKEAMVKRAHIEFNNVISYVNK
ncbi:MAG: 2-hydroxyacid dehydrogenase [Erysipelotrichaceae bacterium]|nr:2-hydroxyacid dehydrogenase [Erysipelotrichaceae bacterium]